jgi:hypothetical protein
MIPLRHRRRLQPETSARKRLQMSGRRAGVVGEVAAMRRRRQGMTVIVAEPGISRGKALEQRYDQTRILPAKPKRPAARDTAGQRPATRL